MCEGCRLVAALMYDDLANLQLLRNIAYVVGSHPIVKLTHFLQTATCKVCGVQLFYGVISFLQEKIFDLYLSCTTFCMFAAITRLANVQAH